MRYPFAFPHFPKINWRAVRRNAKWFVAGMLCTGAIGYAAVVTVLDQVLNATQTYSIDNDKFWVAYDTTIFSEKQCWYVNPLRIDERPRLGRTPMGNYLTMLRLKIGVTGKIADLTPDQQVFCNYLITGTGWTDPTLPPPAPTSTTATAPDGTLTTPNGVWTFGTPTASGGNALMLNGVQAAGGYGVKLLYVNSEIYTFTADSRWFHWINAGWVNVDVSTIPTPAPVVPPPVVPPPVVTPPPPVSLYKVSANPGSTTRPLYDGAAFAATGAWKQLPNNATVAIGTVCEDAVIRHTTVEYHYTTNSTGLRGLAACSL